MPGKKFDIYILQLRKNKRYVGKSSKENLRERIEKHRSGQGEGSFWTGRYKPVQKKKGIHKVYKNQHSWMEDVITIKEMEKIGIDNVRGGPYCAIKLNNFQIRSILNRIASNNDLCYLCGGNHYAKYCREQPRSPQKIWNKLDSQFATIIRKEGLKKWMDNIQREEDFAYSEVSGAVSELSGQIFQKQASKEEAGQYNSNSPREESEQISDQSDQNFPIQIQSSDEDSDQSPSDDSHQEIVEVSIQSSQPSDQHSSLSDSDSRAYENEFQDSYDQSSQSR